MTEAIFRETANIAEQSTSRFADVELVDVGAGAGFVSVTVGLALVWLPLALIIPGGLVLTICLWLILRAPRAGR